MLTCENLTLKNSIFTIFSKVSFTALPGSTLVLSGPNGAGKTSMLRIIAGLIKSSSNKISWNHTDINKAPRSFQKNICYIGHKNALKLNFSVLENLEFWTQLRGEPELLDAAIHFFQLEKILDTKISLLSSGWQRRVELSKLLISDTNLWLLDEPDTSLDSDTLTLLLDLIKIKTNAGRGIVILASHHLNIIKNAHYINLLDFKE